MGLDRTAVMAFTQLAIRLHPILPHTWLTQQGSPCYQLIPPAETPVPRWGRFFEEVCRVRAGWRRSFSAESRKAAFVSILEGIVAAHRTSQPDVSSRHGSLIAARRLD
jgi:hypothetical protein